MGNPRAAGWCQLLSAGSDIEIDIQFTRKSEGCVISMWSCVWLLVDVGGDFLSYQHLLRTFRHPDLVNGPVLCIII